MLNLTDLTVRKYLEAAASAQPTPGGGSASALAGAQGISLAMMVCRLTEGREKYVESQRLCKETLTALSRLFDDMLSLVEKDAEAYNMVSAAYKQAKGTETEKEIRNHAIEKAMTVATEVPLLTMLIAEEAIGLVAELVGKVNSNAASDLGVAMMNLYAAVKGAWLNVKTNLPGLSDREKAENFAKKSETIMNKSEVVHQRVVDSILAELEAK